MSPLLQDQSGSAQHQCTKTFMISIAKKMMIAHQAMSVLITCGRTTDNKSQLEDAGIDLSVLKAHTT